MISNSQLFEMSNNTKQVLKQSGKLIGSGVALGVSGVGKLADQTGQMVYNKLNDKPKPKNKSTEEPESK